MMSEQIIIILTLIPIFLFFATRLFSKSKEKITVQFPKYASIFAIINSVVVLFWINNNGPILSETLGFSEIGFSFRLDGLSMIMYSMVSIIGLIVIRYSDSYLGGDQNKSKFINGLSTTIGLVQILVLSGNLFILLASWVATGISLQRLIAFYPGRRKANLAAKKKSIVSRLGDVSMLIAFVLIFIELGTGDLASIFHQASLINPEFAPITLEIAAVLLVLCAALKSAQLPFHGWLLEVMEAPTPVSALLHAGLLNAGPFLMIRFAFLLDAVYIAPFVLFTIGAITAFFGAVIFITQPTIKNSLAYSSIGHMGFSLMTCGLGVYSAGLLHLVAHSFYKAHAFLSSGSLIEKVRTNQTYGFKRNGNFAKIILGVILSVSLYFVIANIWGVSTSTEIPLLFIGSVILTGVIKLFITTVDSTSHFKTFLKVVLSTFVLLNLFFGLESLAQLGIENQIPAIATPTNGLLIFAGIVYSIFFLTVIIQAIIPALNLQFNGIKKLEIHVRNGFYINTWFNKAVKSLNFKN